nr:hypothetical protein BaRGS_026283 [Batillaria attramentaria]
MTKSHRYGAMAVEEIVRDLACCERRSAQHECLRQLLLVDKLPCSLRELDTRTMVECLKARDPVIRGRSVCCLEQMLLDHRVHKKPTEELMHVITTAYTVIETVDDDDIYRYCNLLMTAMCALACHAKHAGTSDQLQKDLENFAQGSHKVKQRMPSQWTKLVPLVKTAKKAKHHQEVSQRQCNSPKVVAELLRNVLMLASSRIEHLVEEEIDCLICHPSKHVRDVLTELMTRKSLPLLDLSTSYAEKRLEVIGVHAEVNDDPAPLLMAALDIIYAIRFLAEEHIALRDITTYNMVYAVKGEGEDVEERSGTTRPWSQCEDYPPINPAQERRKHAPERGIPPIVHQLLKGDADNYKNLQEYSWAASSSLRVKETELMTSDPITIPPAGESSFICVEEWLTPDFVGNQLPRLESNRAVLPGVVAWAQNRLSPYPDHAVHERQYTRAVTLLHAARRLCRDPLDYAPVAAMVNACLQLTKVVCEIHEQGWLHRDIRASNVLVECGTDQASQEDKVLLARIGRMVYLAGADYVRGEVFTGSRRWMAPEVLHTGIYTKENDVFMLGTTFWEIWNARNVCARDPTATERHLVPLAYVRQKDVENMVQEGVLLPDLPEMPSWLYTLICQCRHPDRKERPSIRDVLFQLEKNSTGYANTISTYGNVNI